MHVTVQHVCFRISLCIQTILPVITDNRIMTEHDAAIIIAHFFIIPDPAEAFFLKLPVFQEAIIVISADQIQPAIQLLQHPVRFLSLAKGKIPQYGHVGLPVVLFKSRRKIAGAAAKVQQPRTHREALQLSTAIAAPQDILATT